MPSHALSASAAGEAQPPAADERSYAMEYSDADELAPIADDAPVADRLRGLALLRDYLKTEEEFWEAIQRLHPNVEPFALSVSSDAFVLDRFGAFTAKAEALFRIPAKRANGTADLASMALPVAVEGTINQDDTISVRPLRLMPGAK